METLDIKELFQNTDLSSHLQSISWKKLVEMIKYKSEWYGKKFIQISKWFPSSKICSNCGYYYKDLGDEEEWTCPHCQTHHDRDINAAKNIKKEHNHYYAVFNIETEKQPMEKTDKAVGIDLGIRTLATLSNGLKITNLDTTHEDKMIKKYQQVLSRKKIQQQPLQ